MKACELKPGDVMESWTVTDARPAEWETTEGDMDEFILLELERGKGSFDQVLTSNPPQYQRKHETRRTWYRSDEEVEVMR